MKHKEQMYIIRENLKREYKQDVEKLTLTMDTVTRDSDEFVTLYHGTSTKYLNDILKKGILPRNQTGHTNWDVHVESIPNVTYLTDKWHYFYAINAVMEHSKEFAHFPCYIECKVPKRLLVMDEDFIHSDFMNKKIEKAIRVKSEITYDATECLNEYGTVGVYGSITPSMIVSFTVLADQKTISELTKKNGDYVKDWKTWQIGKGKGKVTLRDLHKIEAKSDRNGTWWMNTVDLSAPIGFIINQATGKLALTSKEYADHFNTAIYPPI